MADLDFLLSPDHRTCYAEFWRKMDHYKKRISRDEMERKAVLILKSSLKFFPVKEESFTIIASCSGKSSESDAFVEAEDCECRGPEKPHQHYYIDLMSAWECLQPSAGDLIVFRVADKREDGNTAYSVELASSSSG